MADTAARDLEHAIVVIEPLVSACTATHDDPPEQRLPAITRDVETSLELASFYWRNRAPNVMARDPLAIMGHLQDRTCTVARVHDQLGTPVRDGQSTNIAGAAMCHTYLLPVTAPGSERCVMRKHFELGTVRVRMSGFGLLSRLQSVRVLDMLLRRAEGMNPFCCAFEENWVAIHLLEKRHFARVPMPSREMVAVREDELRRAGAVPRPIAYLKPTMATLLDCADELCRLCEAPYLERKGAERDGFASVRSIEVVYSDLYSSAIFDAAREMSSRRPATVRDLGRLLHGDAGYYHEDFVA